jgi:hypothetical protein
MITFCHIIDIYFEFVPIQVSELMRETSLFKAAETKKLEKQGVEFD